MGSIWSDPRIGRLFAEPPERFTAARDAIADDLARSGQRSAARQVRAIRRPTRRLWVLNRIARERRDDLRGLLEAGAELRRAHAAALRGERSSLRDADLELSRRLDALVQVAARVAAEAAHPADHALLVGVRSDLRTIATSDPEDAERLRSGTLDHLPRSAGDGLVARLAATAEAERRLAAADAKEARRRASAEAKEARRRATAARKELRAADRALAAAERELATRETSAERAEATAARSRASAEEARKAVEVERARVRSLRQVHGFDEP